MKVIDYLTILSEQVDIFYHSEGKQYTLIGGGFLQFIGHVIGVLSDNLRKSYLELPVVGGYFLYNYDVDYYYLVKVIYGIETKKVTHTNYRIKRPIKDTLPSEYESLLINESGVLEFAKTETPIEQGTQQGLF